MSNTPGPRTIVLGPDLYSLGGGMKYLAFFLTDCCGFDVITEVLLLHVPGGTLEAIHAVDGAPDDLRALAAKYPEAAGITTVSLPDELVSLPLHFLAHHPDVQGIEWIAWRGW